MRRRSQNAPALPAAALLSAALLSAALLSCGGGTGWILVRVTAADELAPLDAATELDSIVLSATPDGCEARSVRLPPQDGAPVVLPGELVIELTQDCASERVTLLAEGLRGGRIVATAGPVEAEVDEAGGTVTLALRRLCSDADGDGHGDGAGCRGPDCDDARADAFPGAPERCNDRDDDCDGIGDLPDGDGDGLQSCAGDCADGIAGVFPGAEERCNEVDDDCDGAIDDGCVRVGDGGFARGLSAWTAVLIDTEGGVLPGPGIFAEPAPAELHAVFGGPAARVVTTAPGDYTGLMLCSELFPLPAGASCRGHARVTAEHPGAPTAAWAVLRLVDEAYGTLSVGAPLEAPPADGTSAEVSLTHRADVATRARLCLLYRSIRDADRGGPTAAGTALVWDDAALELE